MAKVRVGKNKRRLQQVIGRIFIRTLQELKMIREVLPN